MKIIDTTLEQHISSSFDLEQIRADFPILKMKIEGKPLAYLDSAASSQMPQSVIDRLVRYQTEEEMVEELETLLAQSA